MHIRTAVPFHSKTGQKRNRNNTNTQQYIYTPQLELILELFEEGGWLKYFGHY